MEGISEVSDIINCFSGIEETWLYSHHSQMRQHFATKLKDLYFHTLEFLAKVLCYFDLNTAQQDLRSMVKISDWDPQLQKIRDIKAACKELATASVFEDQRLGMKSFDEMLRGNEKLLQDTMQTLERLLNDNQKIIRWVSNIEVENHHDIARTMTLRGKSWVITIRIQVNGFYQLMRAGETLQGSRLSGSAVPVSPALFAPSVYVLTCEKLGQERAR